jgi:uncharacterized zinc-type alcohol dehydrogenase-like protein
MFACVGYAATEPTAKLAPFRFERRDPGPTDVRIEIRYCGVCHSDLHQVRNEWRNTVYPCVPGHEIVGIVSETGPAVTRFKAGDRVGVGCLVESCRDCAACQKGLQQYCRKGARFTYNSPEADGRGHTFGGYARAIVVDQDFVLRVPETLDFAAAAPLLCAGITTWSPLRHWKVGPGKRVGIVGLGGLGHMGVKLAVALGAEVTLFTTSPGKVADGKRLGAHRVVVSRDEAAMAAEAGRFDFILDAVSARHDINAYLDLLTLDGTLVQVGAPEDPLPVQVFSLLMGRRSFAGSLIGGIPETQEMLDFCGAHGITADIETIRMDEIETAYERMLKSDVRYRFVIDMATLPDAA